MIAPDQVRKLGFNAGEQLLIVPFDDGQFLILPIEIPRPISHTELSEMMQKSFDDAGYTTEESVFELVRDVKREMARSY